jgi:chromosome segregation ATPase
MDDIKCTVAKNGQKYFYRNGKRVKASNVDVSKVVCVTGSETIHKTPKKSSKTTRRAGPPQGGRFVKTKPSELSLVDQITELKQQIESLQRQKELFGYKTTKLEDYITKQNQYAFQLQTQIDDLKTEKRKLEDYITNQAQYSHEQNNKMTELQRQIDSLQEEKEQIETSLYIATAGYVSETNRANQLAKEVSSAQNLKNKYKALQQKIKTGMIQLDSLHRYCEKHKEECFQDFNKRYVEISKTEISQRVKNYLAYLKDVLYLIDTTPVRVCKLNVASDDTDCIKIYGIETGEWESQHPEIKNRLIELGRLSK